MSGIVDAVASVQADVADARQRLVVIEVSGDGFANLLNVVDSDSGFGEIANVIAAAQSALGKLTARRAGGTVGP